MPKPILILQMQRMGDLVLCFPLFEWLRVQYPEHPIWVVGEEHFYGPLLSLSPRVRYLSYQDSGSLSGETFFMVANLSHRPEAAALAGSLTAEIHIGQYLTKNNELHVLGNWQLYRTSITCNNRYNLYHWAQLHALDLLPPDFFQATDLLPVIPKFPILTPGARIGLFVGASEEAKHPNVDFWAALFLLLMQSGMRPLLLGGVAEHHLGELITLQTGVPRANFCGQFSVTQLAECLKEVSLLVTPDTGPMHIAARIGTPVLNLSIGPVNPWETGPFAAGHYVVQSKLACSGCWQCHQNHLLCKKTLCARDVARIIRTLYQERGFVRSSASDSLQVHRTRWDQNGLYALEPVLRGSQACNQRLYPQDKGRFLCSPSELRVQIALFWQSWFAELFGLPTEISSEQFWQRLTEASPKMQPLLSGSVSHVARTLMRHKKTPSALAEILEREWHTYPGILHPLTGYMQMYLANENWSEKSRVYCLTLLEKLLSQTNEG